VVLPGLGDEDCAEHAGDERDAEQQHRFVAEARHATRQRGRLSGRRSAGVAVACGHRIADDAGFVVGGAGVRTGATWQRLGGRARCDGGGLRAALGQKRRAVNELGSRGDLGHAALLVRRRRRLSGDQRRRRSRRHLDERRGDRLRCLRERRVRDEIGLGFLAVAIRRLARHGRPRPRSRSTMRRARRALRTVRAPRVAAPGTPCQRALRSVAGTWRASSKRSRAWPRSAGVSLAHSDIRSWIRARSSGGSEW
jgi:hypothetical protein